jgi:hypothetical protein
MLPLPLFQYGTGFNQFICNIQETPITVLILIETYTVIKWIFDFQKLNS